MGQFRFGRVARACAATAIAVAALVGIGGAPAGALGGSIDGTVSFGGGTLPAGTVKVVACDANLGSWSPSCGGPNAPVAADGTYSISVADGNWNVGVANVQGTALGTTTAVNVAGAPATQNFVVQAAVVNGRVQHLSDGSPYPVGHAVLVLCPINGGSSSTSQALFCTFFGGIAAPTDATGDVTVVVPPGQWYSIGAVIASVYVPGSTTPNIPAPVVDLGVLTDGGTVAATADVAGGFVSGTVEDVNGAPLGSRTVSVCPAVGVCIPAPAPNAQTDITGHYTLALPPGSFVLTTAGQGGAIATTSVTVVDGDDQTGVDFTLGGGSISGSFQQADGSPYNVVNLPLSLCNGSGACMLVPVTNPYPGSSTFTIANVPAGNYDIIAGSPNTSVMAHLLDAPVTVVDGQDSGGEIVRLGGGSITVTVTSNGVPVQSASVRACLQSPFAPGGEFCSGSPFGGTDAAGQITMVGLPPGTYTVRATSGGTLSGSASGIAVSDGNTSTASVALAQVGISGTVTGNTGSGAAVVACPGTTDPPVPWTNVPSVPCVGGQIANVVNGAYSFAAVAPGAYRLRAYALVNNAVVNGDAVSTTVTSGVAVVNLALPGGNSGSVPTGGGTVTLASPAGTSLSGITASAVPASPAPPAGAQFPVGVLSFSVTLPVAQTTADVVLQLPAGSNPNAYYKLRNGVWEDFTANTTIVGDTVTLHLADNDSFDTDPTVGVIGDPGAPVVGDRTGPAVECPATPTFLLRERGATLTANVSDAGAGVAEPTATVDVDTASVGVHSVDVSATDLAGNTTTVGCPYTVQYRFVGFGPLVGNDVLNTMKAGKSAPLSWWLGDAAYRPVSTASSFVGATAVTVPCPALPAVPLLLPTTGSGLKSVGLGAYLYEWRSSAADVGKCKAVTVTLADGTTHSLTFKLK